MCLVLVALRAHPELPLIVLANRDEFRARPTAPAARWADAPHVFAGRDLEKGGTWMGVSEGGRFAAVTNVRDPGSIAAPANLRSRGALVADYLVRNREAGAYGASIDRAVHPKFNLLVGQGLELFYVRDDRPEVERLTDGLHGLSNARLDVFWPKVELGLRKLAAVLERPMTPAPETFFRILADETLADDAMLPSTGVPLEWERRLSAAHITGIEYGTRASTVLIVHRSGTVHVEERTFDGTGPAPKSVVSETMRWANVG
jgi:uncharacterized protein with NRDE domain